MAGIGPVAALPGLERPGAQNSSQAIERRESTNTVEKLACVTDSALIQFSQ
jgi:hypothetical protein